MHGWSAFALCWLENSQGTAKGGCGGSQQQGGDGHQRQMPYVQGHLQEWSLKATLGHPSQLRASIPVWTAHLKGHLPVQAGASDRLGCSSCSAPLLLDATSTLPPAAAGNQGQNSTVSPLGQGRAFSPGIPMGIVLRANTLTPRTRDTSGCALLAPLGFLLLGDATLAFAQTPDAPAVPGCCLCGQMVLMAAQMCWDGGSQV